MKRTHLISLAINLSYAILRFLVFRASCTRSTYLLYFILSSPAFVIEIWLEQVGRPKIGPNGEVKKSGEDLEAKGLTEYLWDVLYWSWGCIVVASIFGNGAWWLWGAIPLYSLWLAYTTFGSMRNMAGMPRQDGNGANGETMSNRQKKMEKRGGQRVQYR